MRVCADSSTLIALASIGELDLLRDLFGRIYITDSIRGEVIRDDIPEQHSIKMAIDDRIEVLKVEGDASDFVKDGLGQGEASMFMLPRDHLLIMDDLSARKVARIDRRSFTGLLGLLIAGVREGILNGDRAIVVLDKLSRSNFRMSIPLYLRTKEEISSSKI